MCLRSAGTDVGLVVDSISTRLANFEIENENSREFLILDFSRFSKIRFSRTRILEIPKIARFSKKISILPHKICKKYNFFIARKMFNRMKEKKLIWRQNIEIFQLHKHDYFFLHNFSVFMIWCLDILFLVIQSVKAKHGIYFCTYVYTVALKSILHYYVYISYQLQWRKFS